MNRLFTTSLLAVLSALFAGPASATTGKDACDLIETHWRKVPKAAVKRIERDSVSFAGKTYAGCRVELNGRMPSDAERESWPVLPDAAMSDHSRSFTRAAGWRNDLARDADGPGGTQFVLRKGNSFCIVNGNWDGGDGDDKAGVPPDAYLYTAQCADKSARKRN